MHPAGILGLISNRLEEKMHSYICPACSSPLSVAENPHIGDLVICQVCHRTYEVVWLFPLELSPVINRPEVKPDNLPE